METNMEEENLPRPEDPNIVGKLVEELKSEGIFDQIRNDCLGEVDSKPAYQNLKMRVESTVGRYLSRQVSGWKPTTNKAHMRNMLRRHIGGSTYLEPGIQGIVEQVVGPKIGPTIEPELELIMYKMFGVEKPESGDDESQKSHQNGAAEKLSDVSDVEMKSADEDAKSQNTDASSPGPGLRGDMSPLTPEREQREEIQSQMSPLTPPPGEGPTAPAPPLPEGEPGTPPPPGTGESGTPPPPGTTEPGTPPPPGTQTPPSPRTPPGPPPVYEQVEEEIVSASDISPPRGSPETPDDSGMPSPPPPPLPPPPLPPVISSVATPPLPPPPEMATPTKRPPSPMTSPIESSSADESQDRKISASDISDAELPASASEKESSDDLEELEKARAALQAQLEAANLNSEEETSGSEAKKSATETETEDEKMADDHEQAKKRDHDEPPEGSDGGSGGSSGTQGPPGPPPTGGSSGEPEKSQSSAETKEKSKSESASDKGHKSHKHRKDRDHKSDYKDRKSEHKSDRKSDHKHRSDHKSDHKDRKSDHKSDRSDRKDRSDRDHKKSDHKSDKKDKHEKLEKSKEKLQKIEAKIKEKSTIISDKFQGFDMFAPKAPKPKVLPKSLNRSLSLSSPTTPASPKPTLKTSTSTSSPKSSGTTSTSTPVFAKKSKPKEPEKKVKDDFIVHEKKKDDFVVKSYPDLPVPQTEGIDKEKQHKDDIAETKRRLAEVRQRKMLEMQRNKELKKGRRKSSSSSNVTPKAEPVVEVQEDIKRYDNKGEGDSDSDIETKKAVVRKNKRKRITQESSESETEKDVDKANVEKNDNIEKFHGFKQEETTEILDRVQEYKKLLDSLPDIPERPKIEGFIQFSASGASGGPNKLAKALKSKFGGNPKVIQALPTWLEDKLTIWNLERSQITIITDAAKIRRKRIYTEAEYDAKCGVTPVKHAKVELDDIEAQLAMMDQDDSDNPEEASEAAETSDSAPAPTPPTPAPSTSKQNKSVKKPKKVAKTQEVKKDTVKADSEEGFRGFELDPDEAERLKHTNKINLGISDMDLYELMDDDSIPKGESLLEVHFSPGLIAHYKKVLAKDKEAMKQLNKIQRDQKMAPKDSKMLKEPQDYPLPPSPESNPSDSSDKGSVSPSESSSKKKKTSKTATPTANISQDTRPTRRSLRRAC